MPYKKRTTYIPRAFQQQGHRHFPTPTAAQEPEFVTRIRSKEEPYSPLELAAALNVSRKLIYKLIDAGELLAFNVGSTVRIAPGDAADYLKRRATLVV